MNNLLTIGVVEQDTGLTKDTLRIWERRYAFPQPVRDPNGERLYPPDQVDKLRLIKRLMDRGHRPGKIVRASMEQLRALGAEPSDGKSLGGDIDVFMDLIRAHQTDALRAQLSEVLARKGLQNFIQETVAPLTAAVGEAWMAGRIAVFEEHLYSELIQRVLRTAITTLQPQSRAPRILLTTLPQELHSLGLLMAEALLTVESASCIALGTQTPPADIVAAAHAHQADIVALSFSSSFPDSKATEGLNQLRSALPESMRIWAGGAGAARVRKAIPRIQVIENFDIMLLSIKQWRSEAVE